MSQTDRPGGGTNRSRRTRRQFLRHIAAGAGAAGLVIGKDDAAQGTGPGVTVPDSSPFSASLTANQSPYWSAWHCLGAPPAPAAHPGSPQARITSWASLGGGLTTRPAVGRNEDGRLEIFARGEDSALWQIWELTGGGWSGWNSLGGALTSNIAVGNNADGRLEVIVRGTDNAYFTRWQTAPNNGWSSSYARLGGGLTSDPTLINLGEWPGGVLRVYGRGEDGAVWSIQQTAPNNGWSDWRSVGGPPGGVSGNIAVGIIRSGPSHQRVDRPLIIARGANDSLYHWLPGDFRSVGHGRDLAGDPTAAQSRNGYQYVFIRGRDGAVWATVMDLVTGLWGGWIPFGGAITGSIAVGRNGDGRLELFVRGTDGALYYRAQYATGSGTLAWGSWSTLGGVLRFDPAVGRNRAGALEVFVIGTDGALYHRWQVTPGGGWS